MDHVRTTGTTVDGSLMVTVSKDMFGQHPPFTVIGVVLRCTGLDAAKRTPDPTTMKQAKAESPSNLVFIISSIPFVSLHVAAAFSAVRLGERNRDSRSDAYELGAHSA